MKPVAVASPGVIRITGPPDLIVGKCAKREGTKVLAHRVRKTAI